MADITVTAGSVIAATGGGTIAVTAGETITAGELVYKDTSDSNKYKKAIVTTAATATLAGIALNGASDGQPLTVQTSGNVNPGATVIVGEIYIVSNTAGGIAPEADGVTGDFITTLGVGTTSSNIKIGILQSGVAVP